MTGVRTIDVALGDRSYPIHVGAGLLNSGAVLVRHLVSEGVGRQVAIVTNDVVKPLWLPTLLDALSSESLQVDVFSLADGESEKSLANYSRLMDFLIDHRHNRTTTLLALGGGVVGDLTGFVAATYQRGVSFLQVPTTLLAQVDSSVGGKTAVNHPTGKNLIGAFHQPRAVICDIDTLATLPDRELRAGFAEVLKYGVIRDAEFFNWLEDNVAALLNRDVAALTHVVERSCQIKAEVVAEDELETGVRAILNFGHTFGHALEALTGYTEYLHGEAIAIGMVMAADLAVRQAQMTLEEAQQIKALVAGFGLPVSASQPGGSEMLQAMGMDKKVVDGTLRLVLAASIGQALVTQDIDASALTATLAAGDGLCDG